MKLDGIRVLDLSRFLPGPYLAGAMADHGADVIKIEDPRGGDPAREIGPREAGTTVYFRNANRGKRSLAIDLKSDTGREAFLRLTETADVIVESFRPGVVDRLGIGYRAVCARAPRIVYASISAFGQSGPYRDRPAHDLGVNALAGVASLGVGQDGAPAIPCPPPSDMAGALTALAGILMALLRREASGRGDHIDLAMFDAVLPWTTPLAGTVFAEGRAPDPRAERTLGGAAFYRPYRTRDGRYVALAGSEIKFVANFLEALGRPDLIPLGRAPAGPAQAPLHAFLEETFAGRTQAEWIAWFAGRDICFAPILTLDEAFKDPHLVARGMVQRGDEDGAAHLGIPIKFADEAGRVVPGVPALGEHSTDILRELGYEANECAAMVRAGIVTQARRP